MFRILLKLSIGILMLDNFVLLVHTAEVYNDSLLSYAVTSTFTFIVLSLAFLRYVPVYQLRDVEVSPLVRRLLMVCSVLGLAVMLVISKPVDYAEKYPGVTIDLSSEIVSTAPRFSVEYLFLQKQCDDRVKSIEDDKKLKDVDKMLAIDEIEIEHEIHMNTCLYHECVYRLLIVIVSAFLSIVQLYLYLSKTEEYEEGEVDEDSELSE